MKLSWKHVVLFILILTIFVGTISFFLSQDLKRQESGLVLMEIENNESGDLQGSSFTPFYVYSDKPSRLNHYVASGFMPDGRCVKYDDSWNEKCQKGNSCIRIDYDLTCSRGSDKWAGIYWLNPANNWGRRKGGFNLTGARMLSFWAKGENGGEQIMEFTVGGITGDYPDSDMATIGPVILTSDWRRYEIDLRGKDLSYIAGGFSWSTSEDVNFDSCVFYLDEVRYE